MSQTFISLRFEQIEKRFAEIDTLLALAKDNIGESQLYQTLCRSAHILLVSHFEGIYKEICRDIIDDLNFNTNFSELKKPIFATFCDYFINKNDPDSGANQKIRLRLINAFKPYKTNINVEPFLFVDNRNPTPKNIEIILSRFGTKSFFSSIQGSDLDLVFQNQRSLTLKFLERLKHYTHRNTISFPYTVDCSYYHPIDRSGITNSQTMWEEFLNSFMKERHDIVHGHTVDSVNDHSSLFDAKVKIQIIIYAFIINICSASNPVLLLADRSN